MKENSREIYLLKRLRQLERVVACAQALAVASDSETASLAQILVSSAEETLRDLHSAPPATLWGRLRRAADLLIAPTHQRVEDEIARALATTWCRLPPPLQPQATRVVDRLNAARWATAVRAAAQSQNPVALRSAAQAVAARRYAGLAEELPPLLAHAEREVADAAERALETIVTPTPSSACAAAVEAAVAAAVRDFPSHRRRGVLELAAFLLDPARRWQGARRGSPLVAWFAERGHDSHMTLRAVIRKSDKPWVRARAWEWLGSAEGLAAAALDRVARPGSDAEYEALLPLSHLIENPARRRRVALAGAPGVRRSGGLVPGRTAIAGLSVAARRGLPRLVAIACEDAGGRIAALEPLLADADAPTRLAALRMLPAGAAPDYCFDPDDRIAWLAAARSSTAGLGAAIEPAAGGPSWWPLVRSPHARVRALAAQELSRRDPWCPHRVDSRLAARRALAADRAGFLSRMRSRLGPTDPARRVDTLMLARALGVAPEVEPEIIAATESGSDRVRATAIMLLGDLGSRESLASLRAGLADPIDRVRANAVEAMVRRARHQRHRNPPVADPAVWASLVELKADPSHRVRANVIHALFATHVSATHEAAASDAAAGMLRDERPPHRVAALWLAERVLTAAGPGWGPWNEFAALVADLARGDPVIEVRTRAGRAAARILAATRVAWRERAAPIAEGRAA